MSMFPEGELLRRVVLHSAYVSNALDRMRALEDDLARSTPDDGEGSTEGLLKELGKVQDDLESAEFYSLRHRAEKILMGLGFSSSDFRKQLSTFSGGWRMRAELAALLVADPDLLLLDEPTNHLDLDARIWLEEYLSSVDAAVWVISHDPAFLDRVVRHVCELEFGEFREYSGNYTWFQKNKIREIRDREKKAALQAERKEKLERFINRFRANPKKRFLVRSRIKMLERMEVIETHSGARKMQVRFPDSPRSSLKVVELCGAGKSYDTVVFEDVNLVVEREDRIGVVGRNGEGKSTLARILAGIEQPTTGEARMGSNVSLGFYSQEVDMDLDPSLDLLEQLRQISPNSTEGEIRNWLGMFLFTGDDVFKKTGVLSGGEKSRLALARILFTPLNLLILDEPTNHLDIFSRQVLKEGLQGYAGTLVLISHDEDLLSSSTGKIFEVASGSVREFRGSFDYYLEKRRQAARALVQERAEATPQPDPARIAAGGGATRAEKKARKRREARERNRLRKERAALEASMRRLERKLLPLEEKLKELEGRLSDPETLARGELVTDLQKEHAYVSRQVQRLRADWDELADQHGKID
jgi:ATP-binding cassette subfamily F protein 3